ncbi:MAG: hypothetical protein ABL997_08915 [Planctomycetota bacterium]
MSGERIYAALSPVVDTFADLGIDYQIGGSVAATTFGHARSTLDVDVVAAVRMEHAAPISRALSGNYYAEEELILHAVRHRSCFNLIYLPLFFKVDVFVVKDTPYAQAAFARKVMASLVGSVEQRKFCFATAEDVILHKIDWFRQGGEVSERQWADILGVLRVQQSRIDMDYLRTWAASLGVTHLLERAVRQSTA